MLFRGLSMLFTELSMLFRILSMLFRNLSSLFRNLSMQLMILSMLLMGEKCAVGVGSFLSCGKDALLKDFFLGELGASPLISMSPL